MYAIEVTCKEVLGKEGYCLVEEGDVVIVIVVEGEFGLSTCREEFLEYHTPLTYDTVEEAEKAAKTVVKMLNPWYIKAKSYKVVSVEPVYEAKIVGWKKTSSVAASEQP